MSDEACPCGGAAYTIATCNTLGASHTALGGKHSELAPGASRTVGLLRLLDKHHVDVIGLQGVPGMSGALPSPSRW